MINRIFSKLKYIILKLLSCFNKNLSIGKNGRYDFFSQIEFDKCKILNIGDNCTLLKNSTIRVRNNANLIIGKNVFINNNSIITCRNKIKIGDNTIIGPNVCIFDHDHNFKSCNRNKEFILGNIIIGNNVWIGSNVTILKNVTIGDNAVIAAGAVVSTNVKKNEIYYSKDKRGIIKYEKEN